MLSRNTSCLVLALSLTALVVTGCGRKGDLDRPGTAASQTNVKTPSGQKTDKEKTPERRFFLDPLL